MRYDCFKIIVNCEQNDSVDIKCGGSPILGYDFYIPVDSDVKEFENLIRKALKDKNQPIMSITSYKTDVVTDKLWDKDMIIQCIKKGY